MPTPTQLKISDIVGTFEGGRPRRYNTYACTPGDKGGVSYGELQASLSSGSLGLLLRLYQQMGGMGIPEKTILSAEAKETRLNNNPSFKAMLMAASVDPIMARAQDEFFYRRFQVPAERMCLNRGFVKPLTILTVMDSYIQGHFTALADKVVAVEETAWVFEYLAVRKAWLTHRSPLLATTTYRVNSILVAAHADNWELEAPFVVRFDDGSMHQIT